MQITLKCSRSGELSPNLVTKIDIPEKSPIYKLESASYLTYFSVTKED